MKHGKNPTLAQKKFMKMNHLDPERWLVVKDTPTELIVIARKDAEKGTHRTKTLVK